MLVTKFMYALELCEMIQVTFLQKVQETIKVLFYN